MLTTKKKVAVTAGLVLSLATFGSKPSQAATLAFSEATVNISNLSYTSPTNSTSLRVPAAITIAEPFTLAIDGFVTADADAIVNVDIDDSLALPKLTGASNLSFGITSGVGQKYIGSAESLALAQVENLAITENTTFSFDFEAALGLRTRIDSLEREQAAAEGNIYLEIFDQSNGDILDFLLIAGSLTTNGSDFFGFDKSANIIFDSNATNFDAFYGAQETEEFATAFVRGTYSRKFDQNIVLGFREVKSNRVSVQVPEPLSGAGIAVAALMGLWLKRKQKLKHE
jgi:hypothetical protein